MLKNKGLVIIPTYNENENVAKLIDQILVVPVVVDMLMLINT